MRPHTRRLTFVDTCSKGGSSISNCQRLAHMSRNFGKMLPARYWQWKSTVLFFLLLRSAGLATSRPDEAQVNALHIFASEMGLEDLWRLAGDNPCAGYWAGVVCSAAGDVITGLDLSSKGINGKLPPSLFKLSDLQNLNLSFNRIQGVIPTSDLEKLANLVALDLSFNNLTGFIPDGLRNLKKLQILNLAGNRLVASESFPSDLFTLPELQTVSLAHNPLGVNLPSFLKTPPLRELILQNCSLVGVLPQGPWGEPIKNLVTLFLGYNNLTGDIPRKFSELQSLKLLALNDNPLLKGYLPDIPNLEFRFIQNTNISSSVNISSVVNKTFCALLGHISCRGLPRHKDGEKDCGAVALCPPPRRAKKDPRKMVAAIVGGCSLGTLLLASLMIVLVRRSKEKDAKLKRNRSDVFTRVSITESGIVQPCTSTDASSKEMLFGRRFSEVTLLVSPRSIESKSLLKLTYRQILDATESFRADYLLGSGGSGNVYKGFIAGQVYAFKVLKPSTQDKSREREFQSELSILGRMSHPNLIQLAGYCQDKSHRALIYEYLRNGSLDDQLHAINRTHLTWHQRLTILLGATRAIDYLHMGGGGKFSPVIHRDLKTSNILVDDQLRAKVSDLGFAKLIPRDKSLATTTGVLGTIGYLAPEYFHTGLLSRKSDIYCLGVVILEAMTGRRPVEVIQMPRSQMHLVYWARLQLRDKKKVIALLDAMLAGGSYCEKSVCKVATVLARCLAEEPDLRPTAAEVLVELETAHQMSSEFQSRLVWSGKTQ